MFTVGDNGKPIAKIDLGNKKIEILSIVDPDDPNYKNKGALFTRYPQKGTLTKHLIPLPDPNNRFINYIAGPSGSGKSTYASELATQFRKIYPTKKIFIFSRTEAEADPAYKKLKPIQIQIDEDLIENPIDITTEMAEGGCLVIFDDCETIHNEKLKREIQKLIMDGLEVGRKLNLNMIITNHLIIPNNKAFGRVLLNEIQSLTVFPKSGSSKQIKYALNEYFGLDNKQLKEIFSLKSRWVTISKTYPQYVLYSGGAYIL
jgi:hypothetical protein